MNQKLESPLYTLKVAVLLCVVCAILVSSAAVFLKPKQDENKKLDIQKSLLMATGLIKNDSATKSEIIEQYKKIKTIIVNLDDGSINNDLNPDSYDQKEAAKKPGMSKMIESSKDLAGIKRRELYSKVFLVKGEGAEYSQIVLPIYGKGLWSTMYGFLSIDPDTKTALGFSFYEHGETPGLGGEVDNAKWKAQWRGKVLVNDIYRPIIDVIKGRVNPSSEDAKSQIDGLSGATLTSNGVEHLFHYWLGSDGFGKFLGNVREGVLNEL